MPEVRRRHGAGHVVGGGAQPGGACGARDRHRSRFTLRLDAAKGRGAPQTSGQRGAANDRHDALPREMAAADDEVEQRV